MYKNFIKKFSLGFLSIFSCTLAFLHSFTLSVFAADPPTIDGALIGSWVQQVLDILGAVLIVSTLAMGLMGAYMWMTSTGDPNKVKQAQGTITWAIIGLIFTLLIKVLLTTFFNVLTT
jgi:uncharacterized BrkB/YihY/UPF0761 family membrane protein